MTFFWYNAHPITRNSRTNTKIRHQDYFMTFSKPSLLQYSGSLLPAMILCALAYQVLLSQGINEQGYFLALGLILGHLLGVFSASDANKTTTPTHDTTSLYVGNLAYQTRREDLQKLFSRFGTVHAARIMNDRQTRKPRGYAFVEMDSQGAAQATDALNNTEFNGRTLRISTAKHRPEYEVNRI